MADKKINVSLSFNADSSQAKKEIRSLVSELEALTTKTSKIANIADVSQGYKDATTEATKFVGVLKSAVNVDTGKLDLSKLNQGLAQSGTSLDKVANSFNTLGNDGIKAFSNIVKQINSAEVPLKKTNSLLDQMWVSLKNTAKWQLSSSIIKGFMGAVQTAYGYAQDLNKSLNDIRIVTGQSSEQMAKFAEQANKAAKALSTTTTDYTNASLIFYQQGLTDEEVQKRTEVTIKMANAAGESAQTVSDQLTAVWNNFYDGSKSLEYYADVMTKLGAATASSTDEIAEGLEKFAAIADTVGLSYEYATAALATVTSNTRQSADVVGTAFKTIFARMQDLELGDTLDDGTTLGTYSEALAKVGINVLDTNGNLVKMDDLLDSIATKWGDLSKAQQVSLAQSVAGVRQYTQLVALMDNWNAGDADSMVANLEYVSGAEGALQEQADIYAESWEAAQDRVQASAEEIYSALIDEDFFIDVLDVFSDFLGVIKNLIDGLGGIQGVLATITTYVLTIARSRISSEVSALSKTLGTNNVQEQALAVKAKANQTLSNMTAASGTREDQTIAETYTNMAKYQNMMVEKADLLTDSDKAILELYLSQYEAMGDLVARRQAAVDEAEKQYEAEKRILELQQQEANAQEQAKLNQLGSKDKYKKTDIDNITFMAQKYGVDGNIGLNKKEKKALGNGGSQDLANYTSGLEKIKAKLKEIEKQMQKSFSTDNISAKLDKLKAKLDTIQKTLGATKVDDIDFNAVESALEGQDYTELFGDSITNLEELKQKLASGELTLEQFHEKLGTVSTALKGAFNKENNTTIGDLVEEFAEVEQAAEHTKRGFEDMGHTIDGAVNGIQAQSIKLSEVFTNIASQTMAVISVWNQIKGMKETLEDPDSTDGDKILSLLTSLSVMLPMVTKAFTGTATAQTANWVASKLASAGFIETGVSASGAAVSLTAFQTALYGAILPIGIIVGAIGGLYLVLKDLHNASAEGQLEKIQSAAEAMEETVSDLNTKAETLQSTLDNYNNFITTFNDCTRGTEEWKDALQDANDAALQIIESMSFLSGEEISSLYSRNIDGLIELDLEKISEYQSKLSSALMNSEYATSLLDYNKVIGQNAVKIEDIAMDLYIQAGDNQQKRVAYTEGYGNTQYRYEPVQQSEVQKIITDNLSDLAEFIGVDEFRSKLEDLGIVVSDIEDTTLTDWLNSIKDMADSADVANEKLKLITQIKADEILGDNYSADEKTYATNATASWEKDQAQKYLGLLTDGAQGIASEFKNAEGKIISGISKTSQSTNEIYKYILEKLQKAGYDVSAQTNNAVRGSDNNRSLAFLNSNGEEIVYNSTQISNMLAAADALDKMGENAEKAKNLLLQFEGEQVETVSNIINNFDQDKQEFDLDSVTADLSKEALIKILDRSSGKLTQQEAADALGISSEQLSNILTTLGTDFSTFSLELSKSAGAANDSLLTIGDNLSKTPKKIFDSLEDNGTWKSLGATAKENVSNLFQEVFNDFGGSGLTQLEGIFNTLGDESDEFANILDDIDWNTVTVSDFNDLMDDAGIKTDLESDALSLLIQAMKDAETATNDLTTAQEKYSSYQEIGNMEMGDTISQTQMDSLIADNPILSEFFTPMADGAYMLTEKAEYFKGIVEDLSFKNLKEQLDLALENSANYSKVADFDYNKLVNSEVYGRDQYDYLVAAGYSDTTKMAEWNEALASQTATDTDFNEMAEAIKECGDQTEYFKTKASELAEEANKIDESIQFSDYVDRINDAGLDFEVTERYAKDLQEEMEATGANYDNVQLAARNLAIANQRLDRGIKSLSDNSEDYTKKLVKENRYTAEYSEALHDLKNDIADIFNASSDLISDEFIEEKIIGNPETMQALADGNMDVINNMRMEIASEQYETALRINTEVDDTQIDTWVTEFNELVANIPDLTIGVDGNIEGENEFITSLNGLIANAGMTRDQVNAMLGSMGMSAKLVTTYDDQKVDVPVYTKVTKITPDPVYLDDGNGGTRKVDGYTESSYTVQTGTEEVWGKVPVTAIETIAADGTSSGGGIDLIGDSPGTTGGNSSGWNGITSAPSKTNTGGGSSGGGSSSNKKAENANKDDIVDRYKEINDAIDDITRATDRASKAADRLYGKSRINALKEANSLLQQEIGLLEQKKSQAESYLATDQAALNAAASAAGVSLTYDSNGNISNYTTQMTSLYNQLQALIDQVNADGNVTDEEQEKIDALQELIDNLKDAISQYDDTKEMVQDLEDEITDKFYEWQDNNYEILHYELEIEIELNDLQLEYIDYYLNKLTDDFYAMAEAAQYMTNQIPIMTESLGHYENFYHDITSAYANGEISQADYVDGMKEAYSSILDQLQALNELDKEMMHYYEDTLDAAEEELSYYTDQLEHLTSVLEHYKNLIELVNGEYDYESVGKILEAQASTLKNELDVSTQYYQMLLTEKQAIEESLANATDEAARELFEEELKAITTAVNEAQEEMLSKTEEWAEVQKSIMENAMAEAASAMEKAFTDGMGFDALSNSLSRLSSYADEYLTKTNQMYETQKLINTAQQAADKSTNEAAKARLKAYQDEIEELQNKNQLSQLELEIAQAKYDVVLAEIALEEAQNAKSTVRLQRDSEGNFGYVYTSDQEQISQAEQDLADAQNTLYNIGLEGANEYGQKLLELKQQLADDLIALEEARAAGQYATDEEYYAARDQLIQQYNKLFLTYSEQYTTALSADIGIQKDAWVNAYQGMINKTGEWKEETTKYTQKCEEAYKSWRETVEEESGAVDSILNDLEQEVKDVTTESDNLKNEIVSQVIPAINNQLVSVRNVTAAYAEQRSAIQALITYYEQLVQEIYAAIAAQAALDSAMSTSSSSSSSSVDYSLDYSALMNQAWAAGDMEAYEYYKQMRDEKINAGYSNWGVETDWIDDYLNNNGSISGQYWTDIDWDKYFNGGLASGGYTGSWGPEGRIAMLHEKELVLNADDTANFLQGIDLLRNVVDMIDLKALQGQVSILPYYPGAEVMGTQEEIQQTVTIEANFPNVQDRNEIQEAFNTLINKASQYANRKK